MQILINGSLLFAVEFRLISSLSVYQFVMYARPVVAIFLVYCVCRSSIWEFFVMSTFEV